MKTRFRFEDIAEKEYPVVKKDILSLLLLMSSITVIVVAIYIVDKNYKLLSKYSAGIVERFVKL